MAFQTLAPPTPDPHAGENTKAIMNILNILGSTEAVRRRKIMNQNILEAIEGGKSITSAALMEPGFSGGLRGVIQRIASPFAAQHLGIEDIIAGKAIENEFDPRAGYYKSLEKMGFPYNLTGPQLEALPFTEEEWRRKGRRKATGTQTPKKPKTTKEEQRKLYEDTFTPEERLKHKVSYAKQMPDEAAEAYRPVLESLGYGDEDVEQLRAIFKEGDEQKISEAIKRMGIY